MFIEVTDFNTEGKVLINLNKVEDIKPWGAGTTKIAFTSSYIIVCEDYNQIHSMLIQMGVSR